MNTYILTLLSASLAAAVAELLAPKGEGGRLVSHIRMVAGLFLLVALLDPLREGLELLREAATGELSSRLESMLPDQETDGYGAVFGDTLTAVSRSEVEAFAVSALASEFQIPSDGCAVSALCAYEDGVLMLTELRISLQGAYMLRDPHPIEAYFTEKLNCPCYVTVG